MRYEIFLATPWTDSVLLDVFFAHHNVESYVVNLLRKHDTSVLFILIDGAIQSYWTDRGEPEDNSFGRDWSWVAPALEQAYETGRKHEKEKRGE